MDFFALDVETANVDRSRICQLGIVAFRSGVAELCWESLIDPEDLFQPKATAIHGIDAEAVRGAPTWPEVYGDVSSMIGGQLVVAHSTFDSSAVGGACERYGLAQIACRWVDSVKLARRVWPDLGARGYNLGNLASRLGIRFEHHDAAEDAWAAGQIAVRAAREGRITLADWAEPASPPAGPPAVSSRSRWCGCAVGHGAEKRSGVAGGRLGGETVVFTGELTMSRADAADLAAAAGCDVGASVTRKTTILVVGARNAADFGNVEKSTKQRRAEELIAAGRPIRIVCEREFRALLETTVVGAGRDGSENDG